MKIIDSAAGDTRDRELVSREAFAEATIRFAPAIIRVLFIAEAPPAYRFNRHFYFDNLRNGDTLFLEMMKCLYGSAVDFKESSFLPVGSAQEIRSHKLEFLAQFKRDGYLLIDASEEPMPDKASSHQKLALLRSALPRLLVRLKELRIDKSTPIVLIGGVTHSVCAQPLLAQDFNVINRAMIDHPARGGQLRFRDKLRHTLQNSGLMRS
jgi:hypothetical protein